MSTNILEMIAPNEAESLLAKEAGRRLASYLAVSEHPSRICLTQGAGNESLAIPQAVLRLITCILEQLAQGQAVGLVAMNSELAPREAAEMLELSVPALLRLLDEGVIPACGTDPNRRVFLRDLLEYQKKQTSQQAALDELAIQAQELGMGY